jgi:hypothetical protein
VARSRRTEPRVGIAGPAFFLVDRLSRR